MTELTLNQSWKLCEGMESESLKMPSEEMSSSVSQPFLLHTLDGDSNDHSCCVCGKFSSCLGSSAEGLLTLIEGVRLRDIFVAKYAVGY